MVVIRAAEMQDASSLAAAIRSAEQSGTMLFDPGERNITKEEAEKMIAAFHLAERSQLFVAIVNQQVAGYLIIKSDKPKRIAHRGYVVIGLADGYRGQGIGTMLFEHGIAWAKTVHIRKLELTVIQQNVPAVKLYEKVGFQIEGAKKHSLYIDGKFIDEYFMGIVL